MVIKTVIQILKVYIPVEALRLGGGWRTIRAHDTVSDIMYHFWFVFPLAGLSSRVTGACPVTADLVIMRVNVRTTYHSGRFREGEGVEYKTGAGH